MTTNQLNNLYCFIFIFRHDGIVTKISSLSPDYLLEKLEKFYGIEPKTSYPNYKPVEWYSYCEKWKLTSNDKNYFKICNLFCFLSSVCVYTSKYEAVIPPKVVFDRFDEFFTENINKINDTTYHRAGTHILIHELVENYFKKHSRYFKLLTLQK